MVKKSWQVCIEKGITLPELQEHLRKEQNRRGTMEQGDSAIFSCGRINQRGFAGFSVLSRRAGGF